MSLAQYAWDTIRTDPRFQNAGHAAQCIFLNEARKATWNLGREHCRKAVEIFVKALDDAFGPHPAAMQPTVKQRTKR